MGASTTQMMDPPPPGGGTVVVMAHSRGFRPALLLDPELPWVAAWKWSRATRLLSAAEPMVPLLAGGPGRARLRSVCAVVVMPTRTAIEIADDLMGGVLAQLDREPGEDLPDDLPQLPGERLAHLARVCGVRLLISDGEGCIATAFNDADLVRLRARWEVIAGGCIPSLTATLGR